MARVNSRRMHQLRDAFYLEGKRLAAAGDPRANCHLCLQPIDYDAAPGTTPDSHELDHLIPVSIRPDLQEDPTGWRHSHRRCNAARGAKAPSRGLGEQVPAWW